MKNFDGYMRKFANRYNISYSWQLLKFGHKRAKIICDTHNETNLIANALSKNKQLHIERRSIIGGDVFEGIIYVMPYDEYIDWKAKTKAEMDKVEEWWMRYHNSDRETRRLMACGKIK